MKTDSTYSSIYPILILFSKSVKVISPLCLIASGSFAMLKLHHNSKLLKSFKVEPRTSLI